MAEFNSPLLSATEIMPAFTLARDGEADLIAPVGNSIGDPKYLQRILDSNPIVVTWDQLATVAGGTTTILSYDVRFPVTLHGVCFVNTAAVGATADVKVDGTTVLDAPEAIAAGTIKEVSPENGSEEVGRDSTITIELIAAGGNPIATPRVQLILQRR